MCIRDSRGADVRIPVPVGTMVFDENTQELLADLTKDGETCVIAKEMCIRDSPTASQVSAEHMTTARSPQPRAVANSHAIEMFAWGRYCDR